MPDIHIERTHDLGIENARARVEKLAHSLEDELQVNCEWNGDTLVFTRMGASGTIGVGADSIDVKVDLGMPLMLMQDMIEQSISERLDAAIA